jgi:hypothetical protein
MEREKDILTRRFGLKGQKEETLEKIGSLHKLTRERVRQIESASIRKLKKLESLESCLTDVKGVVSQLLDEHGGLMGREYLLDILALVSLDSKGTDVERDLSKKNFDFILAKLLDEHVERVDNSDVFSSFYRLKDKAVDHLEEIVDELVSKVKKGKVTTKFEDFLEGIKGMASYRKHENKLDSGTDSDITSIFKDEIFPEKGEAINANKVLYSLIEAAKDIDRNKFGHYGLNEWPEISPKKISDKIFLVLKENGKPMHFTEIAERINEVGFDHKKANAGTVHNELILDSRYMLTDRGMYGLKEWVKR